MELKIPSDALAVFIDETGDETFHDPGNPLFGLGACAVLGRDLDALVRLPWEAVRVSLGQKATARLHAASGEWRMNARKEAALVKYFEQQQFGRVGALANATTSYEITTMPDYVVATTAGALLTCIRELVSVVPCSSVIGVFEDNDRLRGRLEAALEGLSLVEDLPNGAKRAIPLEWCRMPKDAGEPALEVADFMMHAAAGNFRNASANPNKFKRRADAMWMPKDKRLGRFFTVESVVDRG